MRVCIYIIVKIVYFYKYISGPWLEHNIFNISLQEIARYEILLVNCFTNCVVLKIKSLKKKKKKNCVHRNECI